MIAEMLKAEAEQLGYTFFRVGYNDLRSYLHLTAEGEGKPTFIATITDSELKRDGSPERMAAMVRDRIYSAYRTANVTGGVASDG